MKKILMFFSFFIFIKTSSVCANNTYHGIDIDEIYYQIDTGLIGQRVNFDVVGRQYERILYDVLLYQDIYGINKGDN